MWLCECSCGTIQAVRSDTLTRGQTKRCWNKHKHREDLTGRVFGRLTALEEVENNKDNHVLWKCECTCGHISIVRAYDLLNDRTKSCICVNGEREKKDFGESTFNNVIINYKNRARKKGRKYLLTDEEAKEKMSQPCVYCGLPPSNINKSKYNNGDFVYSSLDRIDSDGDYTVDNVNPCCEQCNDAKAKYTLEEYFTWVKLAYEYMHLEDGFNKDREYTIKCKIPDDFNNSAFNRKSKAIRENAQQRSIVFELSKDDIKSKIFDNCFYCGIKPLNEAYSYDKKYTMLVNGLDRRDNSIGYTIENTVPCCNQCNFAKNSYTEEEFCNHIKRVYEYNNLSEYNLDITLYTHVVKNFTRIKSKTVDED
jgi:hypothetical protein